MGENSSWPCAREALEMYMDGLDEETFIRMITGRMTVNEARAKLQLDPLDDPNMNRLFIVDLVGIHTILRPGTVYKAAYDGKAAYAEWLGKASKEHLESREAELDESLASGRATEDMVQLLRTERMLAL